MAVKTKVKNNPDGGFSITIEEDGSGDLNRIMGELCRKHREARERGEDDRYDNGLRTAGDERGEDDRQTEGEICAEILQAISEDEEAALDAELDAADID